jgi:hypothetical protein
MAINGIDEKILFQRHNPSKTPSKKGAVNPYLTKPEDLLREDGSGVLVIDPNKVVDAYNEIKDRYIKQEDLVMYASLKVYKRANSAVVYNSQTGARTKDLQNDAIYVNFLNPIRKRDGDNFINKGKMTSEWTDFFTSDSVNDKNSSDYILDPETFGITNISIKINANHHPIITIEFTDVQGRVLFERGNDKDNPYNIFYTYPYPKFSLKYKGYFGKAIETSLVLLKSNTRFDASTGNYNVTAEFQSDVFSIFNTFLIIYAYVAPYMFKVDNGEFLGGKILKELYERQNAKIKSEVGDDEFPKYEIKGSPTLWDLAGAVKEIPISSLNQSNDINESSSINDILLTNKKTIENYGTSVRDYFTSNPDVYSEQVDVSNDNGFRQIYYVSKTTEGKISLNNQQPQPIDLFDKIDIINEAIKNISAININNRGINFTTNITDSILKNEQLKNFFPNNRSVNIEKLITPDLLIYKNNPDNVFIDAFNIIIGLVFESLERLQSVVEDDYINDQIKDLGEKLGYQPNLTNILRIISNNMQTFIVMLDIIGKSANKQLEVDRLRLTTQGKFSDTSKEFNNTIYSPFPNYFKTETEFEGTNFVNKTVLSYPGGETINSNWFEVRFVEEIYEALNRIQVISNPISSGIKQQTPTSILSVFQLGESDLTVYPTKEYSRVLGEAFSRYAIYMSYSGLLYRGITNFPANISASIGNFEVDLMIKNVTSKMQTDQNRWIFGNDMSIATKADPNGEDGVSYTNLGNFGIKFIGFSDKTLSGSLSVLKPIFTNLSQYGSGSYKQAAYNKSIGELNKLFNSPVTVNSSGKSIGIKNKFIYDMITYKKSDNDINSYSTSKDKKLVPLTHFLDLRPNNTYYCDNRDILVGFSEKFKIIDSDKSNNNSFQGLYINMNENLKNTPTLTDMSRGVNYNSSDNTPALTFNTDNSDYASMGELSPFKNIQKTSTENFHLKFNKL